MKVNIGSDTYEITFNRTLCPVPKSCKKDKEVSVISCGIQYLGPQEGVSTPVSMGTARQHCNDQPNDIIGRKLAFQRALAKGKFTRESRSAFWETYKKNCRYLCRIPK